MAVRSEKDIRRLERELPRWAKALKNDLPVNWGFTLICFQFDGPGVTYASNLERSEMVQALREMADVLETTKE